MLSISILGVLTLCGVIRCEFMTEVDTAVASVVPSNSTGTCSHGNGVSSNVQDTTQHRVHVEEISVGHKVNGDGKLLNVISRYLQKRELESALVPRSRDRVDDAVLAGILTRVRDGVDIEGTHDVCPQGYAFSIRRNECVRKAAQYVIKLLVYPVTTAARPTDLTRRIWVTADELKPHVKVVTDGVNSTRYFYTVARLRDDPPWRHSLNISASFVQLTVWFQVLEADIPNGNIWETLLQGLRKNISVSLNGQEMYLHTLLFNGSYAVQDEIKLYSDPQTGRCCYSRMEADDFYDVTSETIIFNEMSCRFKFLDKALNYTFRDNSLVLLFGNEKLVSDYLDMNDFTFHGDDTISVCDRVYESLYNDTLNQEQSETMPTWIENSRWITRIVCVGISLLGLVVTFVTYWALPPLRTFSNAINMALVMSVLLTQAFYLASVVTPSHNFICRIFGVSIHYFWLTSMFWSTICTFHVFRQLAKPTTTFNPPNSSKCTMTRYVFFANGIPAVVVAVVIASRQLLSRGADIGYRGFGGVVCFLSSPMLFQVAAIAPFCFMLLLDSIFFVSSFCAIGRRRRMPHVTNENDRCNLWIYVKLCAVTTIFWILTLIASALQIPALDYASIFFNGAHGSFLFYAFCCNKRIVDLWRDVFRKTDVSVMTMNSLLNYKADTQPFSTSMHAKYLGVVPEFHEYATPIPPPTPPRNAQRGDYMDTYLHSDALYGSSPIYSTPYTN